MNGEELGRRTDDPPSEETTTTMHRTVELTGTHPLGKIKTIKAIRLASRLTSELGLKDAKTIADAAERGDLTGLDAADEWTARAVAGALNALGVPAVVREPEVTVTLPLADWEALRSHVWQAPMGSHLDRIGDRIDTVLRPGI